MANLFFFLFLVNLKKILASSRVSARTSQFLCLFFLVIKNIYIFSSSEFFLRQKSYKVLLEILIVHNLTYSMKIVCKNIYP